MRRSKLLLVGIVLILSSLAIFTRNHLLSESIPETMLQTHTLYQSPEITTARKSMPNGVLNAERFWRKYVKFNPLSQQDIDGVEELVVFIGYPRSGHSVIGSVIDGHPNAIVAHEYGLFNKCPTLHPLFTVFDNKSSIFNNLYKSSVFSAQGGWRSTNPTIKGYNLHITKWHGAYTTLKVVGDKSGGSTAEYFYSNYTQTLICYEKLLSKIQIPVLFIHVVRNPFDMIATSIIRKAIGMEDMKGLIISRERIEAPLPLCESVIADTFRFAAAVQRVRKFANVLDIFHEEFIANPRHQVKMLCSALHLPCPVDFVNACEHKLYNVTTRSRKILAWPPALQQQVENEIKKYPFFSRYSFTQ